MGQHAFDRLPEQARHLCSTSPGLTQLATIGVADGWDMPVALWRAGQDLDIRYPANSHRTLSFIVGGGWIERLDGRFRGRRAGAACDRFMLYPGGGARHYAYGAGVRVCQIYFAGSLLADLAAAEGGGLDAELRDDRVLASDPVLRRLADDYLARAGDRVLPASALEMDARAVLLGLHLLRRHGARPLPQRPPPGALDPCRLRTAMAYIDAHLAEGAPLAAIAREVGLSPYHFCTAFRRAAGLSPHAFLRRRRLERAQALLAGPLPLVEVALRCGFASQQHFTTAFSRAFGVPPGAWRRAQRG